MWRREFSPRPPDLLCPRASQIAQSPHPPLMSPAPTILTEPPVAAIAPALVQHHGALGKDGATTGDAPARRGLLEVSVTYPVEAAAAAARLGLPRTTRASQAPGQLTLRVVAEPDGKGLLEVTLALDDAERRVASFIRVVVARARQGGLLHIDASDPCSSRRLLALTIDTGTGRALFTRSEAPMLADLPGGVYEPGVANVVELR